MKNSYLKLELLHKKTLIDEEELSRYKSDCDDGLLYVQPTYHS
jgi:hypothetical protein